MKKVFFEFNLKRTIVLSATLIIAIASVRAAMQSDIPPPPGSGEFGTFLAFLPNGNLIVTDPLYDAPGPIADVGAVHLYNGSTLALIASLTGDTANDRVGNLGVTVLPNGNYVVCSSLWGLIDEGAVTFCNGTTGCSGAVSGSNSLIGGTANDNAGSTGITVLSNDNFVVRSNNWDNPSSATSNVGAVTFCNGTTGCAGLISETNSLIGNAVSDQAGSGGITVFSNGKYIVRSPLWDNGAVNSAGAITLCNGTTGCAGAVTDTNSLVGSTASDQIGSGSVTFLGNGNYVVMSPNWDNGAVSNTGAATFCNGATGCIGVVSPTNSLVGSLVSDQVGNRFLTELANNNYVVTSTVWDKPVPLVANVGAVTLCSGTGGCTGPVSASNSLIGTLVNDFVGFSGVTALPDGNYVVGSTQWDNGAAQNAGAATFCDGISGCTGEVSSANSMLGSTTSDNVSSGGITVLTNSNYLVVSPFWNNGTVVDAGSVAFCPAATGCTGALSAFKFSAVNGPSPIKNLTSDVPNTRIGKTFVLPHPLDVGGSFIVAAPEADPNGIPNAGMVTTCPSDVGCDGLLTENLSLFGSTPDEQVGFQVVVISNSTWVARSRFRKNGLFNVGAITLCNADIDAVALNELTSSDSCRNKPVSDENSLTGDRPNDCIGGECNTTSTPNITPLSNGNYIVGSPQWDNGAAANAGAATLCSKENNFCAGETVSGSNSLVGSTTDDGVGNLNGFQAHIQSVCNDPYVESVRRALMFMEGFDTAGATDAGAVVNLTGNVRTIGPITTQNAVIGTQSRTILNEVAAVDDCKGRMAVGFRDQNRVAVYRWRYTASNGGIWTSPSTWDLNAVPSDTDDVEIPDGQSVTLDTITSVNYLFIDCLGDLTGGSPTSFINGIIEKNYCASGSLFEYPVGTTAAGDEYSPVLVNISNLATKPSSLGVRANDGIAPANPPLNNTMTLNRFWSITETGDLTGDLLFNYLQTDVFGDETLYRIIRVPDGGGLAQNFVNHPACDPIGPVTNISPCVYWDGPNQMFISGITDFSDWTAGVPLAPTAAGALIEGRVMTIEGQPVNNAFLILAGGTLTAPRTVRTNQFGYFRFEDVEVGQAYVLSVRNKQYGFAQNPRVFVLTEDLRDIIFEATWEN